MRFVFVERKNRKNKLHFTLSFAFYPKTPFLSSAAIAAHSSFLPLMASHCHCLHNQQQRKYKHNHYQTSSSPSCHCCHSTCCTPPSPFSLPHNNTTIDVPILLQTLATYILQSSYSNPHSPLSYSSSPQPHKQESHFHYDQQQTQTTLLTSLIRRIDALESSLHHLSTSPPPPPPPPTPTPTPKPPLTLRDLAARTIQNHFRAFLVRRSRNLRHLKHLAIIKSNLTLLKSSTHLTSQALSHKAMDLLLTLHSIQGSDPMIRDGKRSISKDLLQFLKFVDAGVSSVTLQQHHHHHNKLSSSYLKQQPSEKKNVRFAENISESRGVCSDPPDHQEEDVIHIEDEQRVCSDHDHQQQQLELVKNLRRRLEELEGCSRDSERKLMIENKEEEYVEPPRNEVVGMNKVGNGNLLFSAPLPVQMEPSR